MKFADNKSYKKYWLEQYDKQVCWVAGREAAERCANLIIARQSRQGALSTAATHVSLEVEDTDDGYEVEEYDYEDNEDDEDVEMDIGMDGVPATQRQFNLVHRTKDSIFLQHETNEIIEQDRAVETTPLKWQVELSYRSKYGANQGQEDEDMVL